MPDFYSEPYLCLAGLTHKSALISWGAFYFRQKKGSDSKWKLVDDGSLKHVHPPRRESIGHRSEPYGETVVEVFRAGGSAPVATAVTAERNACWVAGLDPDTEYTYRVTVNGEEWAEGERRDWSVEKDRQGLHLGGGRYDNRFRTHPDPLEATPMPLTFAVIGDFGVGVKKASSDSRQQREVAAALRTAVDGHGVRLILTTGDNIYARNIFGSSSGDEDDDWFFTYYQPYRYLINRVPVYPSIGNHDNSESEEHDDRSQMFDNFYLDERLAGEEAAGRASVGPGLCYRFRCGADVEFLCIDTSKEPEFPNFRLFDHPKHRAFLESALAPAANGDPRWRIPFCHHPPFCAGPRHRNTDGMDWLVQAFERAGVRAVFSGHEHNFQHSHVNGIEYLVTGAAGKIRRERPTRFDAARTVSWNAACHFLLVTVERDRMLIRPIGASPSGEVRDMPRFAPVPGQQLVDTPIVVSSGAAAAPVSL